MLHFLLISLNVVYVLTTPKPQEREDETLAEARAQQKWEQDNYVCKGRICNAMSDTLFDQYHNSSDFVIVYPPSPIFIYALRSIA